MKKLTAGWMAVTLALAVGMLTRTAQAATHTFNQIGPATYDWTTAGNWTGGVPVSDTAAVVAFLPNTATSWGFGATTINTDPATLTLNTLTLSGKASAIAGNSPIDIGTAGQTWTFDGTTPTVNLNSLLNAAGKTLAFTIYPNLTWNQNITFTGNGTAPTFTFSGNITESGIRSLTKSGTSILTLSGANDYTGVTTISAGGIILGNLNAIANSSSVSVASGATLQLNAEGTYATAGTLSIVGPGAAVGTLIANPGALSFRGNNTRTLNAPLTLAGATTISSFGATANTTLGGTIGGTGPLTIDSRGGGPSHTAVWTLNAASTYSGNTTFLNDDGLKDATVKIVIDDALPAATSLNLLGITAQATNVFTTLDLNGHSQQLAGLTDTDSVQNNASYTVGKRVINSSTLSTLTINNSVACTYGTTGTRVLAGTIGGTTAAGVDANNLALTKTGVGKLTLSGANTYTGVTTISAGTIQANIADVGGVSGALGNGGDITFTGGTLQYAAASAGTDYSPRFKNSSSAEIKLDSNSQTITLAGVIDSSNTGGLTKSGAGTLTLTAENTYNGATTVSAGTLLVNSPGSLDSGSAVTVANGATLGGNGTINGTVSVTSGGTLGGNGTINGTVNVALGGTLGGNGTINGTVTVASGGNVSPGDSAGTIGQLTLANTLTLNGANLYFDITSADTAGTTYDQIANTGSVVLSGGNTVYLNTASGATAGTYWLMTCTGTPSGAIVFPNGSTTMGDATLALVSGGVTLTLGDSMAPTRTWDANNTGGGQTDGTGAWKGANQWWTGTANATWASGDAATFGNGGAGGAVTLASATIVDSLIFNSFSGTYSLGSAGQTITLNKGIAMTVGSGAVTFSSPLAMGGDQVWANNSSSGLTLSSTLDNGGFLLTADGSGTTTMKAGIISGNGGLTKDGSGKLEIGGQYSAASHTYTGTTTINGGVLWVNGDVGSAGNLGSGNLTINDGVLHYYYGGSFTRTLGSEVGEVQILGGASGFGCGNAVTFTINNSAAYEVVWDSTYFSPSALVLNSAISGGTTTLANKLDLKGATRTIQVSGGSAILSGLIRSSTGTAGLTKTGGGALTLNNTGNSFNGNITISGGTLTFSSVAAWGGASKNVTFTGSGTLTSTADGYSGGILTVSSGTATLTPGTLTFSSTTGSGNLVWNTGSAKTFNMGNASSFTGNLKMKLTGNANYSTAVSIQFSSIGDAIGSALQFEGGTSDSQQAATIALAGDVGPLTFSNRQIQILDRTASNWEIRDNILANNNATPANKWVINTHLLNNGGRANTGDQTGRLLILSGTNTGDNEFAGVIGNGTGGSPAGGLRPQQVRYRQVDTLRHKHVQWFDDNQRSRREAGDWWSGCAGWRKLCGQHCQ